MRDLTKEIHQPRTSNLALFIIALLLSALAAWSYYTQFSRVVKANGSIVSMARTQIVQNLEGGILAELAVKEGDKIEAGQIVAQLDTTRFQASVEEAEKKIATYKLREMRLKAEQKRQSSMSVPKELEQTYPELVKSERDLLRSRMSEFNNRTANFSKLINLKQQELNNIERFRNTGAIAAREFLAIEQDLATLKSDRDSFVSEYQKKQATEMAETISQLALLNETIKTTKDQLQRSTVKAPASGTVNQLFFTTIGAVINPGETILEIVPDDSEILVETRVLPKDIGYVVPEMKASLKLTAYDYSIYGTMLGKVVKIGADTVPDKNDPKNPLSYVVTIAINPDSLTQWKNKGLDVRTGMIIEAELEAGSMRIIDYILRPLFKTRDALATI